jgi:ABC-type nickel/cobalt efflux system permease component RcnA
MSRKWLSILLQAAVVVVSLGGLWLFLELNDWGANLEGWMVEVAGFFTLLISSSGLWLVRTYFPPPTWED